MSTTHRPSNVPRWLLRAALGTASALAILQVVGWLTSAPQVGRFRSADDRDAYEAAYREAFATMPTPTNTLDIPTSFGTVRAYEWSNPHSAGAPVVQTNAPAPLLMLMVPVGMPFASGWLMV